MNKEELAKYELLSVEKKKEYISFLSANVRLPYVLSFIFGAVVFLPMHFFYGFLWYYFAVGLFCVIMIFRQRKDRVEVLKLFKLR